MNMKCVRTMKPDQNGTKKLKAKYGFRLYKVRYYKDTVKKINYKTVELIEDMRFK